MVAFYLCSSRIFHVVFRLNHSLKVSKIEREKKRENKGKGERAKKERGERKGVWEGREGGREAKKRIRTKF